MRFQFTLKASAFFALSAVFGCGGSSDEPVDPSDDPSGENKAYEAMESTADKTSNLAGAVIVGGADGSVSLATELGTFAHKSQVLTTSHGGAVEREDIGGNFDYVTYFSQNYSVDGMSYDANGIIGVFTKADDMPKTAMLSDMSSATVTYGGNARALFVSLDGGYDIKGMSSVVVDFEKERIEAKLGEFTSTDLTSGNPALAPFDTVIINGQILGNSFSADDLKALNLEDIMDITGPNATTEVLGYFFGYDQSLLVPDELGGAFLSQGDEGSLFGTFVGD